MGVYAVLMDRRNPGAITAANIRAAINNSNHSDDTVAKATDLSLIDFRARMNGAADFTVDELAKVGGLLGVRGSSFLEGIA